MGPAVFLAVLHALSGCSSEDPAEVALIPEPASLAVAPGGVRLGGRTRIAVSEGAQATGAFLAAALRPATGLPLEVEVGEPVGGRGDIVLALDPALDSLGEEGYRLDATGGTVRVEAASAAGLFYGCQTLRQLLPPAAFGDEPAADVEWLVPAVEIEDVPRFAWRGFMLDVARHFFDVAVVERIVDLMALHKLNRLHLHLTDDQGWRIEIDAWPLLTEVGGSTSVGGGPGGWYTKEDYAAIVAYAAERHVVVVPEIDVPGHVRAAQASYGGLNEDGEPAEIYTGVTVPHSVLALDGADTAAFVEDVFTELAAMTPGPYLHVGGDEVRGLSDEAYTAFERDVQALVASLGKTAIVWEEAGVAGLESPFLAQAWRYEEGAEAAAAGGGAIVASPAEHAYLDMAYDLDTPAGTFWAGFTEVDDAYVWDPAPDGPTGSATVGVEAALWTETVATVAEIDLLTWPRLCGHAELGWSPADGRDWERYRHRLAAHGPRLEAMGVGFYRSDLVEWE